MGGHDAEPAGQATGEVERGPRVDGLYRVARDGALPYRQYIRFYPDGHTCGASSTGTAPQVARWLNRHRSDLSQGVCHRTDDHLTFSLHSPEGAVDYTCRLSSDARELHVESHSHINGHDDSYVLTFEELEQPDLTCRSHYHPY